MNPLWKHFNHFARAAIHLAGHEGVISSKINCFYAPDSTHLCVIGLNMYIFIHYLKPFVVLIVLSVLLAISKIKCVEFWRTNFYFKICCGGKFEVMCY